MELRTKILLVAGYTVVSVGVGYWLVPVKTKIETKTVEVEKVVYKEKDTKTEDLRKHIVITKTQSKDGQVITKTDIDYNKVSDDKTLVDSKSTDAKKSDTVKEVTRGDSRVDFSGMLGIDVHTGDKVYGGSVSKNILGPITGGAWGLSNGTAGISAGISF